MKRNFCKNLALATGSFVLAVGVLGGGIVFATASESNHKTATVNGKSYKYFADIQDGHKSLRAGTYVGLTSGSTQAGLMGALPRVYDSNDYLYSSAKEWRYSGERTVGMNVPTFAEHNGSYYSYGKVKLYNGNTYNTYYTYKSPIMTLEDGSKSTLSYTSMTPENNQVVNINDASTSLDNSEYKVNSNGETYGSGLQEATLGVAPDLIKARGSNGALGYVRSKDLEPEAANNPEEAIKKQKEKQKNKDTKKIPLYEVDGKTVIGEFVLESVNTEDIVETEETPGE
ncbi:hypothetical protein Amet_4084 [Alkaliphilus metalliredigens QYMF]|uniref:Uncharacterized protein n=1 Tax=Alkaliphilus metalliredigens (strain QYMF) TaxID=293826 RepID=A6TVE8_ALKMQ|nr:hypothetical protein [Alkaliphilus metalliredigens]ABR50166.1 hypothetical protein Amet_4084 [Alkaliphilus metalliredigens QYMF]